MMSYYWSAGIGVIVGGAIAFFLSDVRINEAKRHRETELTEANAEIVRLRAQVAKHIDTK